MPNDHHEQTPEDRAHEARLEAKGHLEWLEDEQHRHDDPWFASLGHPPTWGKSTAWARSSSPNTATSSFRLSASISAGRSGEDGRDEMRVSFSEHVLNKVGGTYHSEKKPVNMIQGVFMIPLTTRHRAYRRRNAVTSGWFGSSASDCRQSATARAGSSAYRLT